MSDVLTLIELQADNFKRLKAVRVRPNGEGITKIVGKNAAGKSSVLDAIAAALGGGKHTPEQPIRKGADRADVVLDLGEIIVTKTWKQGSTTLTIVGKDGSKKSSPQAILDKLCGSEMLDPLSFIRLKPAEQVSALAKLANIDLTAIAAEKKEVYDKRREVGRQRDTAAAAVKALPELDAPAEEIVVAELLAELNRLELVNKEKEKLDLERRQALKRESEAKIAIDKFKGIISNMEEQLKVARDGLVIAETKYEEMVKDTMAAATDWETAPTADVAPVKQQLADSQEINRRVRANNDRKKAKQLASKLDKDYDVMTAALNGMDAKRDEAVAAAKFPVPGLGLTDDGVTLAGVPFEQGSQAEQLKASVAIGFALNPKLKLCLIRDGSLLDDDSMTLLATMAAEAGAQVLIERVAGNGETGILIEDGEIVEPELGKEGET